MRKLSLIIIAFTLVLFTQCKKEKITENTNPVGLDGRMVPITLELPVDNGAKTDFGSFLQNPSDPQGTIKWKAGVTETVYLAVPNVEVTNPLTGQLTSYPCAQMIPLTGTMTEGAKYITFAGGVNSAVLNSGGSYTLYYFGNTGGDTTQVTNKYLNQKVVSSVSMSLHGQDGSRDNLGDYHFASLEGVHVHVTTGNDGLPSSYAIHASNRFFTSQVAIAYLDFANIEKTDINPYSDDPEELGYYLYGKDKSVVNPHEIAVVFNSGSNTYEVSYEAREDSEGDNFIKLNEGVKTKIDGSFIALAPGVTSIKAYGEGTYTFKEDGADGATEANHVYYSKNIATNTLSPLEWTPFDNN